MKEVMIALIISCFTVINIVGFTIMGIDKYKAIKKGWRISERTLLLIAFFGGGIGSFLGMYAFRHKTRHFKFVVLLPFAAIMYILLISWILYSLI